MGRVKVNILDWTHKLCFAMSASPEALGARPVIDVRRLRTLRELADRGTIAATAQALHLTPPAVSQQLAALEREVGHRLTEPDGRRLRLTSAAHVLLGHADAIFAELERASAALAEHDRAAVGTVRVGAFATALANLLAPVIAVLRTTHPGLTVTGTEVEALECFERLARRELEIALSMESSWAPQPGDPRFARFDLGGDPLDAAVPAGHPLAGRDPLTLSDLAGHPWIAGPPGTPCHEITVAGCRAAGFSPDIVHTTLDWTTVLAFVAAEAGVALVPRLGQTAAPPGVAIRRLPDPPVRHVFAAARRGSEDAPAVRAVLDALTG
jgi:DNA-binding transcriptional LysR family regulator